MKRELLHADSFWIVGYDGQTFEVALINKLTMEF